MGTAVDDPRPAALVQWRWGWRWRLEFLWRPVFAIEPGAGGARVNRGVIFAAVALLALAAATTEWSRRAGLNRGPADYESVFSMNGVERDGTF